MWMEIEKSKVLIKFLLNFRHSGDVLFSLNVRRLRGYTATTTNNQSQNTSVPGFSEVYITQVSEAIEGRVTKKLSQELSRTKSCILGALSKFLLNPEVRTPSGTIPEISLNNDMENREATGVRSQSATHPKVEFFACRTCNSGDSDPEETSHRRESIILIFLSNISHNLEKVLCNMDWSYLIVIFSQTIATFMRRRLIATRLNKLENSGFLFTNSCITFRMKS